MLKRTNFLVSGAMALCLSLPAFAEEAVDASTIVATINGTEITLGHMIVLRAGLPEQYQSLPDEVLFTGILDQLVQQTVLEQMAGDRVPGRVALTLENERRSLMAAEHMDKVLGDALTDEAVQKAYAEQYTEAAPESEYNASHILVKTEDEAKALVTELDGGADFAELAKEKSTGPSGPRGGELGWFGPGMMVPEFEQAVKEMEVDAISAPIKTQFGWHVIKLNDMRSKDAPALDEVRTQIEGVLSQKIVEDYISDLTAKATIERKTPAQIDPALIKNLSLLED